MCSLGLAVDPSLSVSLSISLTRRRPFSRSRSLVEVVRLQVVMFLHAVITAVAWVGVSDAQHALGAVHLHLRPFLAVYIHQLVIQTRGLYQAHKQTQKQKQWVFSQAYRFKTFQLNNCMLVYDCMQRWVEHPKIVLK